MEADEIQTQGCKFQRVGNGRLDSNKVGQKGDEQHVDEEDDGQVKRNIRIGGGGCDIGGLGRLCGWPSSRIVRVSRASGGKDRHSKVLTSKGLRDRRVRLSVQTAIQFYYLQDRLGFDQPSKAVEWLLKEAASSINELPSINTSFPDTPKQLSDEKRSSAGTEQGFDSADLELDGDAEADATYQQQHASLSKSACSSTSETSKGSASLSRSENRIKARERARERAAEREKEKGNESQVANQSSANPIPQTSFTELLNAGMNGFNNSTATPNGPAVVESNLFHKSARHWSSAPMDYFTPVVVGPSSSRMQHSGFLGQMNTGNSLPQSMPFNIAGDHNQELTHFSIVPDHFVPVASAAGGSDYNPSFTSLAGFNRGTLQSNPPSLLPHLQRFSPIDGSNVPLFIGTAAPNAAVPMENHNQFPHGLDGRLQLFYGGGEGGRHQDQKGRGKNRVP